MQKNLFVAEFSDSGHVLYWKNATRLLLDEVPAEVEFFGEKSCWRRPRKLAEVTN